MKAARQTPARLVRPCPFSHLSPFQEDIYARVRFMLPVAAKLIADGFDDSRCEWSDDIPCGEPSGLSDKQVDQLVRWSAAVYAAGIAVGLCLEPALFDGRHAQEARTTELRKAKKSRTP